MSGRVCNQIKKVTKAITGKIIKGRKSLALSLPFFNGYVPTVNLY